MNRADFFKKLGIGAFTVIVAPEVLSSGNKPIDTSKYIVGCDPIEKDDSMGWWIPIGDCQYSPEEVLKRYKQTGMLLYRYPHKFGLIAQNI